MQKLTFRLPDNIVRLIDSFDGKNRTQRLINAINNAVRQSSDSVDSQSSDNEGILKAICHIESRLSALESAGVNERSEKSAPVVNVKDHIKNEISKLSHDEKQAIISARFPLAQLRNHTNISRTQCDRNKDLIFELLN